MALTRYFATIAVLLAAVSANESPILKRSALLESRQGCPVAGDIPACPGLFACVPPGAICCSDGITYVMPPDTCSDGSQPVATAIASSSKSPSTITSAPVNTQTVLPYAYYTFTITWYYWYYYFTYIQVDATTVTTSYQVTTVDTVSVQATDETQATSLFHSLSATLAFPTPTQKATSLSGSPGPSTKPPPSSSIPSSTIVQATSTSTTSPSVAANTTSVQFTGAATSLRAGSMTQLFGIEWMMGALIVVPGLLMLWL